MKIQLTKAHYEYTVPAHQKSGDIISETVQFFIVITYTFVLKLSKIMIFIRARLLAFVKKQ